MLPEKQFGFAWTLLAAALALHVTDEALTDFLSVWNPLAIVVRQHVPFLPLPTFTFAVWLGGLVLGVAILLALSPFAWRGAGWLVPVAYFLGFLMLANGLGHIAASIYLHRLMPGTSSSPVLIAAAVYLLLSARRKPWTRASAS